MAEKKADIRQVHKYSALIDQKMKADDDLKAIAAQISELTPKVLDYFQRQGIDSIASGNRTLYLRREVHTTKNPDVTTEQACEKLRDVGLPDYVGRKVNTQGLGAYVRELESGGQNLMAIEETFGGAFRVVELFKIGSRKR
jgi:hypothetical protein